MLMNRLGLALTTTAFTALIAQGSAGAQMPARLSLAGEWRFQLDPDGRGVQDEWFQRSLADTVHLPGTTDENHKGYKNTKRETHRLSRVFSYVGPAWYQRDVLIPEDWQGKRISLFLERSKETSVWIDDQFRGTHNSLSTPHVYEIPSAITPGRHVLTIRVDNALKIHIGDPHAVSDHTQTNWNGIVGKIELRATDPVWIKDMQVYPDVEANTARFLFTIGNATGQPVDGTIAFDATIWNGRQSHSVFSGSVAFASSAPESTVEANCALGEDVLLWDEFSPTLYRLSASLSATAGRNHYADSKEVDFGVRKFHTRGTRFANNNRTVFLRGKMDACVYPLTGYAPMDMDEWARIFEIAQSYGINHYRFHTWCPPEAAFAAADQLGFFLQPELPNWTARGFGDPAHYDYMLAETDRILGTYGNHPSFVMFTLGNELPKGRDLMARLVQHCKREDSRHLYAEGSNNFWATPSLAPGDEFWTAMMIGPWEKLIRGSFHLHTKGHINNQPPSTMVDYREAIAGIPVPVVSHEIGQFSVYPDFREIAKYTGVLRARNLEMFRESLGVKHMLDRADDFQRASGKLAVICYKEEIEAALRTPGFGGFHLMDIQDFPGQGAALVGILDAFMDSKGLVTPETYREFCSSTVPLIRMGKYTWTVDETLHADAQVAHFGAGDLRKVAPMWSIRDEKGHELSSGRLAAVDIPQGTLTDLGRISVPLADVPAPAKLTFALQLRGTGLVNHYDIWVYPSHVDLNPPDGVLVSHIWNQNTRNALVVGKRVLLMETDDSLRQSVPGAFQPDFCNFLLFGKKYAPPGTQGLLCDPEHPALARFPTDSHSNWQWWDLVKNSRPIILDDTPPTFRPLVQVIDNPARNHKLGIVFEAKVNDGRLLVCSVDLRTDLHRRPVARQLLYSLLAYMASDLFRPPHELPRASLDRLFTLNPVDAGNKPAASPAGHN